jgi:predicted nucleotidyltransferase
VESIFLPTRIVIDQQAIEAFCRRWGVTELDLFGSAIRDDFRADSDVDVLASFSDDRRPKLLTLLQMEAELEQLFGRKVDLLERRSVERSDNYIRRKHILAHREPLYVAGPSLPT